MALKYAWTLVVHHLLRSSRWADEDKAMTLVVLGVLLCWPVMAAAAWWLLTGRGPLRWILRPSVAFVNPLPRWKYPEGAFERAIAAGKEIHGELPIMPLSAGSARSGPVMPRRDRRHARRVSG